MPKRGAASAVVLGAGIQGATLALALAIEGYSVTLIDAADRPMTRASEVNEGKIHLGHVYARDTTGATAALMLKGALSFAPLIERWVGHRVDWSSMRSTVFTYVQMAESLSTTEELVSHYERLDALSQSQSASDRSNYVGEPLGRLWQETAVPGFLCPDRAVWAADTPEVAVEPVRLRAVLEAALRVHPGVAKRFGHRVESVERTATGFRVAGRHRDGSSWSQPGDVVANCLWSDRLRVDRTIGVEESAPGVFRRKYRVLFERPPHVPLPGSVTMVLGPFGDIVTRVGSDLIYASWYPTCLRGWSDGLAPPDEWEADHDQVGREVLARTRQALADLVPDLSDATAVSVRGEIIYAHGRSDIDEPDSTLHERSRIGPRWSDGFVSIDTGKFTTAPLFAQQVVATLRERGGA